MIKAAAFLLSVGMACAQPALLPWPSKVAMGQGSLAIDASFRVALTGYREPRLDRAVERFLARLAQKTGVPIASSFSPGTSQVALRIACEHAGELVEKLGEDESYRLEVGATEARLTAPEPLGILHGLETFLQLVEARSTSFAAPAITIEDQPRCAWRGLHLDVSRHWMPVEVVKRTLDGMAAVKLNVFHWHLSDDQGFRIESRRFPRLQELGSDGEFYSQEQVRDVIAYARDRGIRVVPEFDVPGHTTSWLVGYPELASAPGPYSIERRWGGFDPTLDPTRESTYEFLDAFFGEMSELFPDQFFHVGGDEVNGKQWNVSDAIRSFMATHQLKDAQALQAYFNRRVEAILEKHGKRMEGWDEILDPDLPRNIVIQSWRGQKSLADAARLGYAGILSSGYYLDHMDSSATLYGVDPLAADSDALSRDEKSRILGGEVAMWGEFVDPENVDSRIWPRAAAVAERLWSPGETKDARDLYRRLDRVSFELDALGLTNRSSYKPMLARLTGGALFEPLKNLADVVEPGSLGQRQRTHKYTQQTPLNRLVDAVRPESALAREFAAAVDAGDHAVVQRWLMLWRDNDARLAPVLAKSFLLTEDAVVSKDLSRLGTIGLAALDFKERRTRPTPRWIAEQRTFLTKAAKVQAELRIAIVPSIQKLVESAAH